jgi:hypothetical protein
MGMACRPYRCCARAGCCRHSLLLSARFQRKADCRWHRVTGSQITPWQISRETLAYWTDIRFKRPACSRRTRNLGVSSQFLRLSEASAVIGLAD